jgi:hypothetical protein
MTRFAYFFIIFIEKFFTGTCSAYFFSIGCICITFSAGSCEAILTVLTREMACATESLIVDIKIAFNTNAG